jgi:hypothetical protein
MPANTDTAAFNARMGELVPELKNKYGHFPMQRDVWVPPTGKSPDGKPAFMASPKAERGATKPVQDGYVWGPGSLGFGYYHLTTKDAYKGLESRLRGESAPDITCCFRGSTDKKELKEIHLIMYARSHSPKPDDFVAREHAAKMNGAAFRGQDDFGLWEMRLKK